MELEPAAAAATMGLDGDLGRGPAGAAPCGTFALLHRTGVSRFAGFTELPPAGGRGCVLCYNLISGRQYKLRLIDRAPGVVAAWTDATLRIALVYADTGQQIGAIRTAERLSETEDSTKRRKQECNTSSCPLLQFSPGGSRLANCLPKSKPVVEVVLQVGDDGTTVGAFGLRASTYQHGDRAFALRIHAAAAPVAEANGSKGVGTCIPLDVQGAITFFTRAHKSGYLEQAKPATKPLSTREIAEKPSELAGSPPMCDWTPGPCHGGPPEAQVHFLGPAPPGTWEQMRVLHAHSTPHDAPFQPMSTIVIASGSGVSSPIQLVDVDPFLPVEADWNTPETLDENGVLEGSAPPSGPDPPSPPAMPDPERLERSDFPSAETAAALPGPSHPVELALSLRFRSEEELAACHARLEALVQALARGNADPVVIAGLAEEALFDPRLLSTEHLMTSAGRLRLERVLYSLVETGLYHTVSSFVSTHSTFLLTAPVPSTANECEGAAHAVLALVELCLTGIFWGLPVVFVLMNEGTACELLAKARTFIEAAKNLSGARELPDVYIEWLNRKSCVEMMFGRSECAIDICVETWSEIIRRQMSPSRLESRTLGYMLAITVLTPSRLHTLTAMESKVYWFEETAADFFLKGIFLQGYAGMEIVRRNIDRAIEYCNRSIEAYQHAISLGHPYPQQAARAIFARSFCRYHQGQMDAAFADWAAAVSLLRDNCTPSSGFWDVGVLIDRYIKPERKKDKPSETRRANFKLFRYVLILTKMVDPHNETPLRGHFLKSLGDYYARTGAFAKAVACLDESIALLQGRFPLCFTDAHPRIASLRSLRARYAAADGRRASAGAARPGPSEVDVGGLRIHEGRLTEERAAADLGRWSGEQAAAQVPPSPSSSPSSRDAVLRLLGQGFTGPVPLPTAFAAGPAATDNGHYS